ncbi:MAG TPA: extracellular solute-binding protein [Clostridiales bacterium]|nr:extracellular solute-binding protein [Clostridiales bacterium]
MKRRSKVLITMLTAFLIIGTAFSLSACKSKESGQGGSSETKQGTKEGSEGKNEEGKGDESKGDKVDISGTTIRFSIGAILDENGQKVWDEILNDYHEKSGVTVELEQFDNSSYRTWITTQHAANSAPDVMEVNYSWGWDDYTKGYLIDFNEHLSDANPYFDNKTLEETMSPILMQQAVNPNNKSLPGIPSKVLGVKVMYNKTLFEKAGIDKLPTTVDEFFEACEKLKAVGVVPFGFANAKVNDAHMNWWLHNFISQMDQELRDKMDLDGNGFVTKNELVAATDNNLIDFTASPFKDSITLLKEFSQYWNSDFNSTDVSGIMDLWLSEKVAMMTIGSFQAYQLEGIGDLGFEYGLMPLPIVTENQYPSPTGKSLNNGGKLVDTYVVKANKDAKKQAAALDFVQFMLSPEPLQKLMDGFMIIPPVQDMPMSDNLKGWLTTETEDVLHANYFGYATSKEFTDFQVLSSQVYLMGDMDMEEYTEGLNKEWSAMSENAKVENGWSKENEYGMKAE